GGPLVSIPFAVVTAAPRLGRALVDIGFCRLPEETAPPAELRALGLPAIEISLAAAAHHLSLRERIALLGGVLRSLRIYYLDRSRRDAMVRLYGGFIKEGDLAFDIGAHVGDRTGAFRTIGARVVALEPQPAMARVLRLIYGRDRAVVIEPMAVGSG